MATAPLEGATSWRRYSAETSRAAGTYDRLVSGTPIVLELGREAGQAMARNGETWGWVRESDAG
jgi:hypothetical protein